MNYYDYIKSDEWKNKREWALRLADNKCQVCNGKQKLNVHHRTYENLGYEKPGDIIVLCVKCHELFHDKMEKPPVEIKPLEPVNDLAIAYQELKDLENGIEKYQISKYWNMPEEHKVELKAKDIIEAKRKIVLCSLSINLSIGHERIKTAADETETLRLLKESRDAELNKKEIISDDKKMLEYFDLYCSDKIT
jgi:hypothetical protein